jgi:hypothetical protein
MPADLHGWGREFRTYQELKGLPYDRIRHHVAALAIG